MNNVLSIDFDYWCQIPEIYESDWVFIDNEFFSKAMWNVRYIAGKTSGIDLRDYVKLSEHDPTPIDLYNYLADNYTINNIGAGSSHVYAYDWFDLDDMVVYNIDAHHDLGYGLDTLNCDNWIKYLIDNGMVNKVVQIYPNWRLKDGFLQEDINRIDIDVELEVHYGIVHLPDVVFERAYISHSGPWVAPWLDEHFVDLLGFEDIKWFGPPNLNDCIRSIDYNVVDCHYDKIHEHLKKKGQACT